jgi:hypothetical protein
MAEKNSFIFYHSWDDAFNGMTDEEAGKMIKAMIFYSKNGVVNKLKNSLKIAFGFIKAQMDLDAQKYEKTCENRANSGKKGGRPSVKQKAKKANGFEEEKEKQKVLKKAKKPDDEDDDEDDDVYNTHYVCDISHAPTREDVEKFCKENNLRIDVETFYCHYSALGWKTSSGVKIEDWKALAQKWHAEDKTKQKEKRTFVGRDNNYNESNIFADVSKLEA